MGSAPRMMLDAEQMTALVAAEIECRLADRPHATVELWRVAASVETVLHDAQGNALFRWRVFPVGRTGPAFHGAVRGDVTLACRQAAEALATIVRPAPALAH